MSVPLKYVWASPVVVQLLKGNSTRAGSRGEGNARPVREGGAGRDLHLADRSSAPKKPNGSYSRSWIVANERVGPEAGESSVRTGLVRSPQALSELAAV